MTLRNYGFILNKATKMHTTIRFLTILLAVSPNRIAWVPWFWWNRGPNGEVSWGHSWLFVALVLRLARLPFILKLLFFLFSWMKEKGLSFLSLSSLPSLLSFCGLCPKLVRDFLTRSLFLRVGGHSTKNFVPAPNEVFKTHQIRGHDPRLRRGRNRISNRVTTWKKEKEEWDQEPTTTYTASEKSKPPL